MTVDLRPRTISHVKLKIANIHRHLTYLLTPRQMRWYVDIGYPLTRDGRVSLDGRIRHVATANELVILGLGIEFGFRTMQLFGTKQHCQAAEPDLKEVLSGLSGTPYVTVSRNM